MLLNNLTNISEVDCGPKFPIFTYREKVIKENSVRKLYYNFKKSTKLSIAICHVEKNKRFD